MVLLVLLACGEMEDRKAAQAGGAPRESDSGAADTAPVDTAGDEPVDTDTGEATAAPMVEILSPADGAVLPNPVTFRVRLEGVARAKLDADGYAIGEFEDLGESVLEREFTGTGYTRVITLTGLDASGDVVASDRIEMEVEPEGVSLDVPYFYQYDNAHEPGSTCGITSAAMLVDFWHSGSVTPDVLYGRYGKAQGQSPSGLAALYEAEGLYAEYGTWATRSDLRDHLDDGRPVVVHGYWTGSGHIAVIVGYTDTDWIVNDPAGDWYNCYGCGEADHIAYPLGGAWDAEMSTDGDIWWSTAADAPF